MTIPTPRSWTPVALRIDVTFPAPASARLAVAGEIDLATAPVLGTQLFKVMTDHHAKVVDVDLGDVTFLDCSEIAVLVAVRNAAQQEAVHVWISRPQPMPARLLNVVGVLGLFTRPNVSSPS